LSIVKEAPYLRDLQDENSIIKTYLFKLWYVTDEKFIDYKYIHFIAVGAIDFSGNLGTWGSVFIYKHRKISRISRHRQCTKEQVGKCTLILI
jgi:hypothetical protein